MSEKIYIIGHKSPDLDSVAGAISYAKFRNIKEGVDIYTPAIAGDINLVTDFVLKKFNIAKPEIIDTLADKKVILVDHNEATQSANGIESAEVVEVLDHHQMDFKNNNPIMITVKPWGSSCSIITQMYFDNNIEISNDIAGLMLSAALDDTVITKSPTCTDKDKDLIKQLAKIAEVADWKEYGIEMFKAKASVEDKSAMEILKLDFKDFEVSAGKFGIGQVETVDLSEFEKREEELMTAIETLKKEGAYHTVILFITDILDEGSNFLVQTDDEARFKQAMGAELTNNKVYITGVVSRKKQVVPKIKETFDK